ncbi:hypothetical protein AB0L33_13635 [Streptomyces sp. NPDC052299]|uniref:hypothetical protein n=1 Tax=Streptomyces sp. NPDC052299 TaxID=3155054 RepID=UPI00342578AC
MRGEGSPSGLDRVYPSVFLGSLLGGIESGWSPACDSAPPAIDEWGVLKVSAVSSGRFLEGEAKRLLEGMRGRPDLEVHPGDVLLTRANGVRSLVGIACHVSGSRAQLMLSDKTLRLVPKPSTDPAFLVILLSSQGVRRQIQILLNGGTGQNNISQADVRTLQVPEVPMEVQRRIVAVHSAFERRIGVLERELGKLDLLRCGLRDSGVSGPLSRLGEVLAERPKNGYSPSEVDEWTGLLALGLGCLTAGGFVPKQLKRIPDSPMARKFTLVDGDLLMSRANTRDLVGLAGRYRDVGQSCIYPDLMMRLRPDERRCLPAYLEMALASSPVRAAIRSGARGTSESMVKISAGVVEALHIPLPSLEKQREVVEASALLDSRIVKQRAVIAKLRTVQQGVCEDLLAGAGALDPTSPVSRGQAVLPPA